MQIKNYIYFLGYHPTEKELSQLESESLFNQTDKDKLIFSDIEVNPSCSAFLKKRLDVTFSSPDYSALIEQIRAEKIKAEGFKAEYVVLDGDTTQYADRLSKLKDIGYSVEGLPDYHNPAITYGLCFYNNVWFFGILVKNSFDWHKHNKKPYSYSNSINIGIAKALVNIAAKNNKETKLLDACCGVGTIMLEACFAGNNIEGCDINWKVCRQSRENLAHFNYTANVYRSDIKDITNQYDVAIIDLPYNLFSCADHDTISHIIKYSGQVANKLVIVSASDIAKIIDNLQLKITAHCSVNKQGKTGFAREIWVCEKRL